MFFLLCKYFFLEIVFMRLVSSIDLDVLGLLIVVRIVMFVWFLEEVMFILNIF